MLLGRGEGPSELGSAADRAPRSSARPRVSTILAQQSARGGLLLAGRDAEAELAMLEGHSVTHILQVGAELSPSHPTHFTYRTLDVVDRDEQDIVSILPECFAFMRSGIAAGVVLVHCVAGVSRSAAVVVAFLMWALGLPFLEARARVKAARPIVNLNLGFSLQLQLLDQEKWAHHDPGNSAETIAVPPTWLPWTRERFLKAKLSMADDRTVQGGAETVAALEGGDEASGSGSSGDELTRRADGGATSSSARGREKGKGKGLGRGREGGRGRSAAAAEGHRQPASPGPGLGRFEEGTPLLRSVQLLQLHHQARSADSMFVLHTQQPRSPRVGAHSPRRGLMTAPGSSPPHKPPDASGTADAASPLPYRRSPADAAASASAAADMSPASLKEQLQHHHLHQQHLQALQLQQPYDGLDAATSVISLALSGGPEAAVSAARHMPWWIEAFPSVQAWTAQPEGGAEADTAATHAPSALVANGGVLPPFFAQQLYLAGSAGATGYGGGMAGSNGGGGDEEGAASAQHELSVQRSSSAGRGETWRGADGAPEESASRLAVEHSGGSGPLPLGNRFSVSLSQQQQDALGRTPAMLPLSPPATPSGLGLGGLGSSPASAGSAGWLPPLVPAYLPASPSVPATATPRPIRRNIMFQYAMALHEAVQPSGTSGTGGAIQAVQAEVTLPASSERLVLEEQDMSMVLPQMAASMATGGPEASGSGDSRPASAQSGQSWLSVQSMQSGHAAAKAGPTGGGAGASMPSRPGSMHSMRSMASMQSVRSVGAASGTFSPFGSQCPSARTSMRDSGASGASRGLAVAEGAALLLNAGSVEARSPKGTNGSGGSGSGADRPSRVAGSGQGVGARMGGGAVRALAWPAEPEHQADATVGVSSASSSPKAARHGKPAAAFGVVGAMPGAATPPHSSSSQSPSTSNPNRVPLIIPLVLPRITSASVAPAPARPDEAFEGSSPREGPSQALNSHNADSPLRGQPSTSALPRKKQPAALYG